MTGARETIPRAVVTGGAGAIGSQLVRRLLDDGTKEVTVVDDMSSGFSWLLRDDPRLRVCVTDVANIAQLGISAAGSVVFHLAAFFANQNSVDHPLRDLHTNGAGTLATLSWACESGASRVVYASAGCSIAGHGLDEPIREDMPVSLNLDTPYQITKALGEFYCNYFSDRLSTVRCRFFNSYGPGELPGRYRNVIPNFIWSALHGSSLPITGTGDETRDFIFVDDLVDGLVRAATTKKAHGLAINLGTGRQTRVADLAKLIIECCDSTSETVLVARRPWDRSLHREADVSLARRVLDFEPRVTIEEGIAKTVAWFQANMPRIHAVVGGGR